MGELPGDGAGVATIYEEADVSDRTERLVAPDSGRLAGRVDRERSLHRFSLAAAIGTAVVAVPFLWVLWSLWSDPSLIRSTIYQSNFYDLQARSIFHGHLWIPNGSIGIEAFVHGGHQYTYFGLFPSLLRMPVLLVTSRLDDRLTAPSILIAWLLTALLVAMLVWRVRILVRGQAAVGRLEATALGALVATSLGGTVLMFLAATPYVFNEDIVWSICLTIGSVFGLLGVLERPSWGRIVFSFIFILAANLNRATTGWACVLAAVLIAVWFGLGRSGQDNRRLFGPMLVVGMVPLLVSCAVNYAKFGMFFGVPSTEQVWTQVNAYRRQFLAANHNSEVGLNFIRSDLVAYLRPDGIRLTANFPFITLPASPAPALGGVLFDKRYRTMSLPASTPLLFVLSLWGLVVAFRPRPLGRVALTRILLICTAGAGGALLLWGYIAPRYLGDFVPFLVLASSVAMVDVWRRLNLRSRRARVTGVLAILAVAGYSVAANIGVAVTPTEEWSTTQVLNYAQAQKSVSDLTGVSLAHQVSQGTTLPTYAPADRYFIIGNCDGLYISNGEDYRTVPSQQFERATWLAVERGHSFEHSFRVEVGAPSAGAQDNLALVQVARRTVYVTARPVGTSGSVLLTFGRAGGSGPVLGLSRVVPAHSVHQVSVITDPASHLISVILDGRPVFTHAVIVGTPISVPASRSETADSQLSAVDQTQSAPQPTLCRDLLAHLPH